jgi:hypothetical protein
MKIQLTKESKTFGIRIFVITQAVALFCIGLVYTVNTLSNLHYNTFTKPFIVEDSRYFLAK